MSESIRLCDVHHSLRMLGRRVHSQQCHKDRLKVFVREQDLPVRERRLLNISSLLEHGSADRQHCGFARCGWGSSRTGPSTDYQLQLLLA